MKYLSNRRNTTSPEAMKRSQEKSVEGISIVERQNVEEKPIVSENDRHKTISERVYIEQPELKDLKEAGLKPPEMVLESIVSMKHGQDANTMQYETLNIHPDLIISEIPKQGDLKQYGIETEGTFESSETSEDGFFSLAEKMGIASTSVITIPAALATTEIASAYECVMEKHQQSLADSELEDNMFNVKKRTTTYGTESEIPANGLEVEVKKVRLFENIIIPDERVEEYGSVISKTPTTEERHVSDMKSPGESEIVDQLRKTEDLVETETKSFEDIIPDERNFEEYGAMISKTPTTEERHVTDMKSLTESKIVDQLRKTEDLVETETKSFEDIIPDERNFEEYGSVISKTPTTEERHVTDMKSPTESEIVDQLRKTEDLVGTEGGPFDDNISDREILGERGAMICNEGTTKGHTEMERWRDLQKTHLCRMGDLEEAEGEPFEDIMQGEKILEDYAISGYEFASIKEKPVSPWNARCEADKPMKQYGNMYVTDSESEHLQSKVVKSARNATEVAIPIVLAKFRMSEVRGVDGDEKDMQMISETASSETRRVVLERMQSQVNDVSEERSPVESNDRVAKGDVCTKEQVTLPAKAPATECLKQECADHTLVPAVERENRLVEIYKTTVSEHEILQPLENVQHQPFMKKDLEETETKQFESVVSECHFSQSYDFSVAKEIIIGE
uniref:Ankyrin-2 n=1 Tax=Brugia pahangi TaxID=6280 RepID=A0A0N4TBG9_BRUPA